MMAAGRHAGVCLLAMLLAACGSAPIAPPPGYLLPSAASVGTTAMNVQVRLAGYLEQGGIVYQLSDSEMHNARQHRWAEPLAQQLRRSLHAGLSEMAPPNGGQLTVQLSQFQGVRSLAGDRAIIRGVWQYNAGGAVTRTGQIDWQGPLTGDGYAGLVETLDQGWQDVAHRITAALHTDGS